MIAGRPNLSVVGRLNERGVIPYQAERGAHICVGSGRKAGASQHPVHDGSPHPHACRRAVVLLQYVIESHVVAGRFLFLPPAPLARRGRMQIGRGRSDYRSPDKRRSFGAAVNDALRIVVKIPFVEGVGMIGIILVEVEIAQHEHGSGRVLRDRVGGYRRFEIDLSNLLHRLTRPVAAWRQVDGKGLDYAVGGPVPESRVKRSPPPLRGKLERMPRAAVKDALPGELILIMALEAASGRYGMWKHPGPRASISLNAGRRSRQVPGLRTSRRPELRPDEVQLRVPEKNPDPLEVLCLSDLIISLLRVQYLRRHDVPTGAEFRLELAHAFGSAGIGYQAADAVAPARANLDHDQYVRVDALHRVDDVLAGQLAGGRLVAEILFAEELDVPNHHAYRHRFIPPPRAPRLSWSNSSNRSLHIPRTNPGSLRSNPDCRRCRR